MDLTLIPRYLVLSACLILLAGRVNAQGAQPPKILNVDGATQNYLPAENVAALDPESDATVGTGTITYWQKSHIVVRFIDGYVSTEDQLLIWNNGQVDMVGRQVFYQHNRIGACTGGFNGLPLYIRFTTNVTQEVVQQVIRALGYVNVKPDGPTAQTRRIGIILHDGFGNASQEAVSTINVTAGNRPPTANDLYYNTAAGTAFTVPAANGLLAHNHDPEGKAINAGITQQPVNGILTSAPGGAFTYTPNAGFTGLDSLQYQVTDADGIQSGMGTAIFAVGIGNNLPPPSRYIAFGIPANQVLFVPRAGSILKELNDPNSGNVRIFGHAELMTPPQHGTLQLSAYGNFIYTPNPGYAGTDNFVYRHCDAQGACSSNAQVAIEILNNQPPFAVNDYTQRDTYIMTGNVLTNDRDPDGNALTASLVTAPVNGTVVLNADGSFTYTANDDKNSALDSLIYQVCDNGTPSLCDTAVLMLETKFNNQPPVITAPAQHGVEEDRDTTLVNFSFSDPDAGSDEVKVDLSIPTGRGKLTVTPIPGVFAVDSLVKWVLAGSIADINQLIAGGGVVYTPPANESGITVPMTIYINDKGHNGPSGEAADTVIMELVISAVNDAPVLTVPGGQAVPLNTTLHFNAANQNEISMADVDAGGGQLQAALSVTGGTLSLGVKTGLTFSTGTGTGDAAFTFTGTLTAINNALASLSFTPAAGFIGEVTLTATVNDQGNTGTGGALTDSKQVRILVGPQEPLVTGVTASTANGLYKTGSNIIILVHFNKAVTVTGTPQLTLQTGSVQRTAAYTSGSSSTTLTFTYTVQEGDASPDLDYTAATALQLNSGTIRNTANTMDALLTLPAPGAAGSLGAAANIAVDGIAPRISTLEVPANGNYKAGDILTFKVTADDNVILEAAGAAPSWPVTIGAAAVSPTFSGMQGRVLTFTYTIPAGAFDADGIEPAATLQFPAGKIHDQAGNHLLPAIPGAGLLANVRIDAVPPVVTAAQAFTLAENAAGGTQAGTIAATDAAALLPLQQWQIVRQSVTGVFALDAATGALTLQNAAALDYAQQPVHEITVTVSDGINTSTEAVVRVTLLPVNKAPTLNPISNVSICPGGPAQTLQLSGITPGPESGQTVALSIAAAADNFNELTITDNGSGNAAVQYRLKPGVNGATSVTVTVKDNGGTQNGGTDTFERTFAVQAEAPPVINVSASPGTGISKGTVARLTATGADNYTWQPADGIVGGQNTATVSVRPFVNTTYHVTGTAANGCTGEGSIAVTVIEDYKLEATNILTPNGDGKNDRWVVRNIDAYPNNEVKIFDRSGRMVYTKRGYANEWDGTANGTPLQEGAYYFILELGPGLPQFKGSITIIRGLR
ncbi:Ig-like domain-containing protein [Chitinophaga alhagiae]|uniref:Ig-like domain-containing protein n=1 Tax=Chitinophaga alhagiae TaxID=2203219 RepID=UPI000E5C49CF|nr:Ig-like domain-containing protein [Chitinophaga alhagiae]